MSSKIMKKALKEVQEKKENQKDDNTNSSFFPGMEEPPNVEKDDIIDDFAGFSETESPKIMKKALKEGQEEEEDHNNTNSSFFRGIEEPPNVEEDDAIDNFAGFSITQSQIKIMKKAFEELEEEEEDHNNTNSSFFRGIEEPSDVEKDDAINDFAGFSQTQSQFGGNEEEINEEDKRIIEFLHSQQFTDSLVAKMKACSASVASEIRQVPKIDKSMIDMYKGGQMGPRVAAEVKEVDDQKLANGDDKGNAKKNHIEINNLSNNEGIEETTEAHKKLGSKISWNWPVLQEHRILTAAGILGALAAVAVAYIFYRSG